MYIDPVRYEGRPGNVPERLEKEQRCYALLDELQIPYARVDHEHADTIEACEAVEQVLGEKILPVEAPEADEETGNGSEKKWKEAPYIFMPDAHTVLSRLLPEYVQVKVYNAMLQSAASELGSRMAAMSAATDNATERIADLNLTYNKARQAQVTNEISEIVGGAAALE